MAPSIASRAKSASRSVRRSALVGQDWRLAIEHAARRQKQTPPGAPLWHFLTRPASIAYTDDGELALELGDPPLVLISSDAALLPELYLELEAMRYGSQLRPMTDAQRQHQARIYTAGAYLADALEQLADGLQESADTKRDGRTCLPGRRGGQVSIALARATRPPLRAPNLPASIHHAV